MDKHRILIVDDDVMISDLISLYLEKEMYEVMKVHNGLDALSAFNEFDPSLILLDLMLPGIDGYEVCREIRKNSNVPIIMMSAKGEVFDKVLGLELGADDYIIKPFDSKELVARVKALLRRSAITAAATDAASRASGPESAYADPSQAQYVSYPDLIVNLTNYSVTLRGQRIDMPPKELELLYFLAKSPNQVFTRDQLLDHIWGYEYQGDTRTVDVHVKRIREKIGEHPSWRLATVHRIGYKFEIN